MTPCTSQRTTGARRSPVPHQATRLVRRVIAFARLPPRDRRLVLRSALWLAAIHVALPRVPLPTLLRALTPRPGPRPVRGRRSEPDASRRAVWAVDLVGRALPRLTCLERALAVQVLLARHGERARLVLGVARDAGGRLRAHAWLEQGGRVLIGDDGRSVARYRRLPAPLDPPPPTARWRFLA